MVISFVGVWRHSGLLHKVVNDWYLSEHGVKIKQPHKQGKSVTPAAHVPKAMWKTQYTLLFILSWFSDQWTSFLSLVSVWKESYSTDNKYNTHSPGPCD